MSGRGMVVRRDGQSKIPLQTIHNVFGNGIGDHPNFRNAPATPQRQ